MIAINFGCETDAIELNLFGTVLKYGESALCWRITDGGFLEFFCPTISEEAEITTDEDDDEFDFEDDFEDDIKEIGHL